MLHPQKKLIYDICRDENIKINLTKSEVMPNKHNLPTGFNLKSLNLRYMEEIYTLLCNHYLEDSQQIVRKIFSRDFLYWHLKCVPDKFIIGLTYYHKLVGIITAIFIDMMIEEKKIKMPYINLLCLHAKLRNKGFEDMLINEIETKLHKIDLPYFLFVSNKENGKYFCKVKIYAIPINYQKLKDIGFLNENIPRIPKLASNPLHIMKKSDIKHVIIKLNKYLSKYKVRPYFIKDTSYHFLLPKKNIVYSFVRKNSITNEITDFVTVYKYYLFCKEQKKLISTAQLSFYFNESMNLTELIICLINKLLSYHIDQLFFHDMMDNRDINLTKFDTYEQMNYYLNNIKIPMIDGDMFCYFPF